MAHLNTMRKLRYPKSELRKMTWGMNSHHVDTLSLRKHGIEDFSNIIYAVERGVK